MCTMFYTPSRFPSHYDQFRFSSHGNLQNNRPPIKDTKQINAASIPLTGIEVAVHMVSEQDRTPRMRDDDSYGASDEQVNEQPNGLGCDEGVGRCV